MGVTQPKNAPKMAKNGMEKCKNENFPILYYAILYRNVPKKRGYSAAE